jgi:hypothetical protein
LADSLFTHKSEKNLPQNPENLTSPRKVAGNLRINILKTVQKIINMKSIDFARHHYHISVPLQKDCKKCKRYDYQSRKFPIKHKTNLNKNRKWRDFRTRERCLQYNMALCLEGEYFKL